MDLNISYHTSPYAGCIPHTCQQFRSTNTFTFEKIGCTPHTCQQYRSTNAFTFEKIGPHTVGSISQDSIILYVCFCDDILAFTPGQPIRIIPRRTTPTYTR